MKLRPLLLVPIARLTHWRSLLQLALWTFLGMMGGRAVVMPDESGIALHGLAAADDALLSWLAPLVLPFLAFVVTSAVVARHRLDDAASPLVALGASRNAAVVAHWVVTAVACALLGAAVTVFALVGAGDDHSDIWTSTVVAAVATVAYGSLFLWGSTFGKRGGGRTFVFVVDVLFGNGRSLGAAFTPRAHLRNLLGGIAPVDVSPHASWAILALFAIVPAGLAIVRARRVPRVYAF